MYRGFGELTAASIRLAGVGLVAFAWWRFAIGRPLAFFYLLLLLLASPRLAFCLLPCLALGIFMAPHSLLLLAQLLSITALVAGFRFAGAAVASEGPYARFLVQYTPLVRWTLWTALAGSLGLLAIRGVPVWEAALCCCFLALLLCTWPASPPEAARTRRVRAALVMGSILFSFLLCEAAVRLLVSDLDPGPPDIHMFHPEAGMTLRPGSVGAVRRRLPGGKERWISATVSPEGLRDREFGPRKPNEFRVFLLGDSFAMGWGLELEESLPKALERRLRAANIADTVTFTVMNGGVDNFGPWQEHIFLRERGFPLSPCLVLHEIFLGNDIENTLLHTFRVPKTYCNEAAQAQLYWFSQDTWPWKLDQALQHYCRLYKLVVRAFHRNSMVCQVIWRLRFLTPPPHLAIPPSLTRTPQIEACLREWDPLFEEGWRELKRDVLDIRNDCESRGVDYAAFCIPEMSNSYDGEWKWNTRELGADAYERFKDVRLPEEFFQQEGIPYASVREAIANVNKTTRAYLKGDGHLTPEGVEAVAEVLAQFIITRYFPEGDSAGRRLPRACLP